MSAATVRGRRCDRPPPIYRRPRVPTTAFSSGSPPGARRRFWPAPLRSTFSRSAAAWPTCVEGVRLKVPALEKAARPCWTLADRRTGAHARPARSRQRRFFREPCLTLGCGRIRSRRNRIDAAREGRRCRLQRPTSLRMADHPLRHRVCARPGGLLDRARRGIAEQDELRERLEVHGIDRSRFSDETEPRFEHGAPQGRAVAR